MWTKEQIQEELDHQDGIVGVPNAKVRADLLRKILGEHPK